MLNALKHLLNSADSADDFFLSAMDNRFLELLLTLEELPEGIKPIFA